MMKLDFQVGTSQKAHKILQKLAGKKGDEDDSTESSNNKAPFKRMADAYLFALMLGLSTDNKTKVVNQKNYANFSSVEGDHEIVVLLTHLGSTSDTENKEEARIAIQEYATWGLLKMDEYKLGDDDYRFGDLLEELLGKSTDEEFAITQLGIQEGEGVAAGMAKDKDALKAKRSGVPPGFNSGDPPTWQQGLENRLARAGRPGYPSKNVSEEEVDEWISKAKQMGIKTIICHLSRDGDEDQLAYYDDALEDGLIEYYKSQDFNVVHIPQPDKIDGTYQGLSEDKCKEAAEAFSKSEEPVVVHCSAGKDRTGDSIDTIVEEISIN
jgi:protein tyrosine phosphatase (PTP) superfamily phosphohydrolase (DUF442 family)